MRNVKPDVQIVGDMDLSTRQPNFGETFPNKLLLVKALKPVKKDASVRFSGIGINHAASDVPKGHYFWILVNEGLVVMLFLGVFILGGVQAHCESYSERQHYIAQATRNILIEQQGQRALFASQLRTVLRLPAASITTERLQ